MKRFHPKRGQLQINREVYMTANLAYKVKGIKQSKRKNSVLDRRASLKTKKGRQEDFGVPPPARAWVFTIIVINPCSGNKKILKIYVSAFSP
jgi:hypothetical protein